MNIEQMPSAFGRGTHDPHTILWHCMGQFIKYKGRIYFAKHWLDHLGISAHFLVDPTGVVIQLKDIREIAWHAKGFNTNHIGVEILVQGVWSDIESLYKRIKTPWHWGDQYTACVELQRKLDSDHKSKGLYKIETHSNLDKRYEGNWKVKQDLGDGFPLSTFISDCGH